MRIGHVELTVADMERSRRFYLEALGADLVASQGPDFTWIRIGKLEFLLRKGDPGPASPFPGRSNIVLCMDDVPGRVERLRKSGVAIGRDGDDFTFQDPDGHWFQIVGPGVDSSAHTAG
ncbi:MAG: VOC family protein [Planctomycetes bacterium]|nr:VOC family protein [Planctomycetota bacterium]